MSGVVEYLSDLHGIQIRIDEDALKKAKIDVKTPVYQKVKDVRLGKALREMLWSYDLSFMVKDHVLTITTPDIAKGWQKAHADLTK